METRDPRVRERPNLVSSHLAQTQRTAQVVTYATTFGVLVMFLVTNHRLAAGIAHAAAGLFNAIFR